jgi:DHA1 family bicyclomycin/chloramphenicol resistance-like MFS transporter
MAVVGQFVDGTARPMLVGIAGSALLTLALTYKTLGGGAGAAHA